MKISSEKGFSLIEMMVVIAVLGIVLAIAAPNFRAWRDNTNLREAARDISSDISLYRQRAVAENIRYQIVLNQGANNYTVNVENPAGSGAYTPLGPPLGTAVTKSPGTFGPVVISNITFAGAPPNIIFEPRGTISAGGTVTLRHTVLLRDINVTANMMGRTHVDYP